MLTRTRVSRTSGEKKNVDEKVPGKQCDGQADRAATYLETQAAVCGHHGKRMNPQNE